MLGFGEMISSVNFLSVSVIVSSPDTASLIVSSCIVVFFMSRKELIFVEVVF